MLLSERTYLFDPRSDSSTVPGVPAAGVLTMVGGLGSFARERLRGARWLEIFACQVFSSPPADAVFNPYVRDPGKEGPCQYCHASIDAASIHFKRFDFIGYGTPLLGTTWLGTTHLRWDTAFISDTLLTPVSDAVLTAMPDSHLIDFLDPSVKLLGQTSDGTIGPLGFAKLIVSSGEFDRCAVRRLTERFTGQQLNPGFDDDRIDALTAQFVANGRRVKPFVRALLSDPSIGVGW
jgi:hypothetical protein